MAEFLITGAAGFLGSWIAEEIVKAGFRPVVVDDLSGGRLENIPDGTSFMYMDLCEEHEVDIMVEATRPEVLVHLAANAREGASYFQPISVVRRNTLAFTNILTHCVKWGVKKVVLFSSMAVYGNQIPPFTEDMPKKPVDVYGMQKAVMEDMLAGFAKVYGFDYVIIRPHNAFGKRQALYDRYRNVIGIWMNRLMQGEPVVIFGDGEQKRAFSYIENSLPAYMKAILTDVVNGEVVNIGGLVPITIEDLLLEVVGAMRITPVEVNHLPERPQEVKYAYCKHEKAIEKLGYEEKISLPEGIAAMAAWALEKGPQEWRDGDPLEIDKDERIPLSWR